MNTWSLNFWSDVLPTKLSYHQVYTRSNAYCIIPIKTREKIWQWEKLFLNLILYHINMSRRQALFTCQQRHHSDYNLCESFLPQTGKLQLIINGKENNRDWSQVVKQHSGITLRYGNFRFLSPFGFSRTEGNLSKNLQSSVFVSQYL